MQQGQRSAVMLGSDREESDWVVQPFTPDEEIFRSSRNLHHFLLLVTLQQGFSSLNWLDLSDLISGEMKFQKKGPRRYQPDRLTLGLKWMSCFNLPALSVMSYNKTIHFIKCTYSTLGFSANAIYFLSINNKTFLSCEFHIESTNNS